MKNELQDALKDLGDFLDAARPYLDQIVFVGGWVPYFYRSLPEVRVPDHEPLLTKDFDLATSDKLALAGTGPLAENLRRGDFVVIHSMDPEVLRYQHRRRGEVALAPIHFEFLTALQGSVSGRKGASKALLEIQAGLQAQRLRHLELLLHDPIEVDSRRVHGLRVKAPAILRVPNPATYLIQKALIHASRKEDKAAKDFAYAYEVALLWSDHEKEVRGVTESMSGAFPLWRRRVQEGGEVLARAFESEYSEGPISVEKELRVAGVMPAVTARAAFSVVRPFLEKALGVPPVVGGVP